MNQTIYVHVFSHGNLGESPPPILITGYYVYFQEANLRTLILIHIPQFLMPKVTIAWPTLWRLQAFGRASTFTPVSLTHQS